jgi:hypothetical protein
MVTRIMQSGGSTSGEDNLSRRAQLVDPKAFISPGMYRIAERGEQDWRKKQVKEIKMMLFRSPQPQIMKVAIQ